jgi:hypothetical protein
MFVIRDARLMMMCPTAVPFLPTFVIRALMCPPTAVLFLKTATVRAITIKHILRKRPPGRTRNSAVPSVFVDLSHSPTDEVLEMDPSLRSDGPMDFAGNGPI